MKLTKKDIEIIKPYFTTEQLSRYYGNDHNDFWLVYTDKHAVKNIKHYPAIKAHLDKYRSVITSDNKPYGLHRSRDERFFMGSKIIALRKTAKPCFTFSNFPCYVSQTYNIIKPEDIPLQYLTGILNSKLVYFWLRNKGKKQGDILQIDKAPLLEIPIRTIDFEDGADVKKHDKMVELVEQMLDLNKRLQATSSDHERNPIQRRIDHTDNEIDNLVYELYDLTEEEIKIVEGE